MSDNTHFEIQRGSVLSDCMEKTYEFITQNLDYLHESLIPVREEVVPGNEFKFICYEKNWSFAVNVEQVELGQIASGSGIVKEGGQCAYDELLEGLGYTESLL